VCATRRDVQAGGAAVRTAGTRRKARQSQGNPARDMVGNDPRRLGCGDRSPAQCTTWRSSRKTPPRSGPAPRPARPVRRWRRPRRGRPASGRGGG
jgi:hypothetical protein